MDTCICDPASMKVDPDCTFCSSSIELAKMATEKQHEVKRAKQVHKDRVQAELDALAARKKRIQVKVSSLFDGEGIVTDFRDGGFNIEFSERDTSFADLSKLSEVFGTKDINMGTENRNDGFCETCSYSYTVNVVRVDGISEEWR